MNETPRTDSYPTGRMDMQDAYEELKEFARNLERDNSKLGLCFAQASERIAEIETEREELMIMIYDLRVDFRCLIEQCESGTVDSKAIKRAKDALNP
jgi:hypothetical protein